MATRDRDVSNIRWERAYVEGNPHRFYRTEATNPFLSLDNTPDMHATVDTAYGRIVEDALRLRIRNQDMAYTDSNTYQATNNPTSRTGSVVMPLDHSTLNDMKSRLNCIESILSNAPGYESSLVLAANAADYSDELTSLLKEFDREAANRGLLDISDPDNRALAELCRSVLRKAASKARKTGYAKEAAARKSSSPELDSARISYLNTRIAELDKILDNIKSKANSGETRIDELKDYTNKLKEAFERHADRQTKALEHFNVALVDKVKDIEEFHTFLALYKNQIELIIGSTVPTLKSQVESLQSRVDQLEVKLNSRGTTGITWVDSLPKWTCRT